MKPTFIAPILLAATPALGDCSNPFSITAAQLLQIAPKSKSCDNPPAAGECATAEQAALFITASLQTYNVTSRAEQAAVIGLMAFESVEFKYNRNHFPGRPGQGTRNMQMPDYNLEYAESIPELADELAAVRDQPDKVLGLLLQDETYDFGSGPWFLTSQCGERVRHALREGGEQGWREYLSQCVGTTVTDARKGYWEQAREALGVSS